MRIKGLDFLRAIAILLVLIRHSELNNNVFYEFGWLGVDLFFVISGFLVSGLLFSEFKKEKKINIKRFFIRRAFKIYPSFYFFLLVSLCVDYTVKHISFSAKQIASEVFYLQNYCQNIFSHSWSLAVEEHFYILISLVILMFGKYDFVKQYKRSLIIVSTLFLLIGLYRIIIFSNSDQFYSMLQTHLRLDGILIGVIIAILFHFTSILEKRTKYDFLLLLFAAVCIYPGFKWNGGDVVMKTYGLSIVCIGFGVIVSLVLKYRHLSIWESVFIKPFAFIGRHSYSIYLWHLFSYFILLQIFHVHIYLMTIMYIFASIAVGSIFSLTVENYFLKLRNKVSPSV